MQTTDNLGSEINRILTKIKNDVMASMPAVIEGALKPEIVANSPSSDEEREMLSRDVSGIGTYEGGRFLRQEDGGVGMPVWQAVAQERPIANGDVVSFLNKEQLRNKTVFAWRRANGEMLSISPDEWFFVNALEYGGARYTVTPRSDRKFLYPQDGMFKQYMVKAIPPKRMFWNSVNSDRFFNAIFDTVKRACGET
ncbi:MAG: hypothetical protein PHW65_03070 [Dehalococcoidales bacterium]|jgi:hypothetical protein|nr:hypothetical protein [Dehalococcoidales bacterium]